jgi:hypothetical protein
MAALNENAIALLSTTTVTFGSTAQTTLYTVPVGKTLVIDHVKVVASADATTATVTIGKVGALTGFVGTQTLSGLNAAGAVGRIQPLLNATTVKSVYYVAGDVIQVDVTATGGGTTHKFLLYGQIY